MSLALAIFLASLYLPDGYHVEFLYPLIVLLSLSSPDNRSTFDISVGVTVLLAVVFLINPHQLDISMRAIPAALPILFVWSFTFAVIKYKESQQKLLRSTEHLNAMFEHATEGILISNVKGEIVMANPMSEKQLGYEHGELVGKRIEDLVPTRFSQKHPEHRKTYYENPHSRAMGSGLKLSAKRKDGSEFPVEISLSTFRIGQNPFVISFIIDITERHEQEMRINKSNEELEFRVISRTMELAAANKSLELANQQLKSEMQERNKVEVALRDSERLYSTIAHNFPDGIICVLDVKLEIVFIDGNELRDLNLDAESLIGKSWRHMGLCAEEKSEFMGDILRKVFQWESATVECEFQNRNYSLNSVPLPDDRGNIREILLVIRNVTRRKKAEKEILHALEKERTLNEMKSRFVSMASHEFRTPLSTILSSLTLVDRYNQPEQREKQLKHIERIRSSVKNLTEILNDFLSLEKLEAGKVELQESEFDVVLFCEEMTEELQAVAKPGQEIRYTHTGGQRSVNTDKQLLRNILINLLNNAIKYSNDHQPIELVSSADHTLQLKVIDHGIGIPAEEQNQLFERFFRASNAGTIQGTGLGLNIVKRYTELLQGNLTFKSEANKGTTFTIILPLKNN